MRRNFIRLIFLFLTSNGFPLFSMENIKNRDNILINTNSTIPDFLYPSDNLIKSNQEVYLTSIENIIGTSQENAARYKTILDNLVIKFSSLTALKQQSTIQNILEEALKRINNINYYDRTILEKDMNEVTKKIYETLQFSTIKFEINLINIYKTHLDLEYFNRQKDFLENMDSNKLGCFSNQINRGVNEDAIPATVSTHQNYILHSRAFGSHYPCLEIIDTINNDYEFTKIHIPKFILSLGYQIICYFVRVLECDTRYIVWFEGYNPSIELNRFVNIYDRTDEEIIQSSQKIYFNLIQSEIERTTYVPPRIANKSKITPIKERSTRPRKQITRTSLSAPTNSNPNTSKTNNLPPINLNTLENMPSTPSARKPAPLSAPDRMLKRNNTIDHK